MAVEHEYVILRLFVVAGDVAGQAITRAGLRTRARHAHTTGQRDVQAPSCQQPLIRPAPLPIRARTRTAVHGACIRLH
jgi:hypothetical protein